MKRLNLLTFLEQILEHEIGGKKPDLEKLRQTKHHHITEQELQKFKVEIDRVRKEA
jgi:hypothetical protein